MFVLVSSRNNYNLFENFFLKNNDLPNSKIINCDAGSTTENKNIGIEICNKNNINFYEPKNFEIQLILSEVIEKFINKSNSKWLLCLHTDSYLRVGEYKKLIKLLNNDYFDKFGLIGLNTIFWPHTKKIEGIKFDKFYFGLMGKSILSDLSYSVYGPHTIKNRLEQKKWNNLAAVETVMDIGYLINMKNFRKFIKPSNKFPFICSIDDIGLQFLNNNIYNVTLPDVYCVHDPWVKKRYNMPVSSPIDLNKQFNKNFYNDDLSYNYYWKKKWKFDRQFKSILKKPIVNNNIFKKTYTFLNNIRRPSKVKIDNEARLFYKDNLIAEFISHKKNIPLAIFKDYEKFINK